MCLQSIYKNFKENNDTVVGWQVKTKTTKKGRIVYSGCHYLTGFHNFKRFTKCNPPDQKIKSSWGGRYKPGFHIYLNQDDAIILYEGCDRGYGRWDRKFVLCKVEGKSIICKGTQDGIVMVCEKLKILKEYKRPPKRKED